MRTTLLALLTALTFDTWSEPGLLAQSGADDRGVIAAVIEHIVRPHLALQARRETADLPVYVAITSVPLCASGDRLPCVEKATIDTINDHSL
jgi:hypothetical protein